VCIQIKGESCKVGNKMEERKKTAPLLRSPGLMRAESLHNAGVEKKYRTSMPIDPRTAPRTDCICSLWSQLEEHYKEMTNTNTKRRDYLWKILKDKDITEAEQYRLSKERPLNKGDFDHYISEKTTISVKTIQNALVDSRYRPARTTVENLSDGLKVKDKGCLEDFYYQFGYTPNEKSKTAITEAITALKVTYTKAAIDEAVAALQIACKNYTDNVVINQAVTTLKTSYKDYTDKMISNEAVNAFQVVCKDYKDKVKIDETVSNLRNACIDYTNKVKKAIEETVIALKTVDRYTAKKDIKKAVESSEIACKNYIDKEINNDQLCYSLGFTKNVFYTILKRNTLANSTVYRILIVLCKNENHQPLTKQQQEDNQKKLEKKLHTFGLHPIPKGEADVIAQICTNEYSNLTEIIYAERNDGETRINASFEFWQILYALLEHLDRQYTKKLRGLILSTKTDELSGHELPSSDTYRQWKQDSREGREENE